VDTASESGPIPVIMNADADMSRLLLSDTRTRTDAGSRTARFLITLILVGALFVSRFGWVGDSGLQLPLTVVVTSVALLALALLGRLRVQLSRAGLFSATLAAMIVAMLAGGSGRVSVNSFMLLVIIYIPYIFILRAEDEGYSWCIARFRTLTTVVAVAGILQFFAQLIIPGPTLFTFEDYIPAQYLLKSYHLVIPVWGGLNKSNGFFLLEPSIFSQLMALSIIVELLFFPLSWRLIIFITGSIISYSGTGLMLIVAFVPFLLLRRGEARLFLFFAGFVVFALIFTDALHLSEFAERTNEFGMTRTSGFARFVAPFYLVDDYVLPSIRNTLFGLGPGAIDLFVRFSHDPTWVKLFFEYGMVGFLPFSAFIFACFFADSPSKWLSAALFADYALLGGNLVNPILHPLYLILGVLHKTPSAFTGTNRALFSAPRDSPSSAYLGPVNARTE
jgi:hypothetical protein